MWPTVLRHACMYMNISQLSFTLIAITFCRENFDHVSLGSINPLPAGSGYSQFKNCVFTAGFSAIILGPCSSERNERMLTLALVYMVIDLCVLFRNEKAKFA